MSMANVAQSLRLCLQVSRRTVALPRTVTRQHLSRRRQPFSSAAARRDDKPAAPPSDAAPAVRRQAATEKQEEEEEEEEEDDDGDVTLDYEPSGPGYRPTPAPGKLRRWMDVDRVEKKHEHDINAFHNGQQRAELDEETEALTEAGIVKLKDIAEMDKMARQAGYEFKKDNRPSVAARNSFFMEDESDPDLILNADEEQIVDEYENDDMTAMGHAKLEEHREHRAYARAAIWEMPLLSKFARKFEPPTADMPLRFRYTSYMGEHHPAEKKVVVEFCPSDLGLTDAQQLKMKKLAGVRYNPETDIIKMSCESFDHQAQNKRFLGDTIAKLVAEAKDPTDMFEDIPLDLRHHKIKTKPKFPKEWRMTEERVLQLQQLRAKSFLLEQRKKEDGTLINGAEKIQAALNKPTLGRELLEPVMVSARQRARR